MAGIPLLFDMARIAFGEGDYRVFYNDFSVLRLIQDTGQGRVLYDALELELPTVDPALVQQKLEAELNPTVRLRRAIVVPNTRIAYMARTVRPIAVADPFFTPGVHN